jgi:hypothetical protein
MIIGKWENISNRKGKEGEMKRSIAIIAMTMMLSILFCNQASASGYIKGQLWMKNLKEMNGVTITIFNDVNAEIVNTVYSDIEGYFTSAPLNAGQYKIHFKFKYKDIYADICIDEFYGQPFSGYAVFDMAADITVVDNMSTDLGTFYVPSNARCDYVCQPATGRLGGNVTDSSGNPVPSIQVKFKDPTSAFPVFNDLTADANGAFYLEVNKGCAPLDAKIRFYDPNGVYSPEYFGAGGADIFSQGQGVTFTDLKIFISEDLAKVPPAEQIVNIIGDIQTILPPQDAQPLVASLLPAQALLQDANPNNDKGACGVLTGSVNKMDGLVSSGRLSQKDADALKATMDALKLDLGCKK